MLLAFRSQENDECREVAESSNSGSSNDEGVYSSAGVKDDNSTSKKLAIHKCVGVLLWL